MMKPIFLSLFFLSSFAVSPARAALFCGMRRNVACLIEAINEGRSSRVVKNLQAGADPNGEEDGVTTYIAAKKRSRCRSARLSKPCIDEKNGI